MGSSVVRALDDIKLRIKKGAFVCVLGPSGSGKSTLLNMIGGLDKPSSGSIKFENNDIVKLDENGLANHRKKKVGFVFQSYNLLPNLTALENVQLPLIFARIAKEERATKASSVLEEVGLSNRLDHKPAELSGGEQQRVSIARALINRPAVVLADEPTGNLDTKSSVSIMELLRQTNAKNGQTFIMVTHNQELAKHADKVIYMKDGQIEKEEENEKN